MDTTILKSHFSEPLLRRIIDYGVLLFLFLQPFIHHTATIRAISLLTALTAWLLLLQLYPGKGWKKNPLNRYLWVYAAIVFFNILIGFDPKAGFKALSADLFYQLAIYFILVNNIESRQQIRRILYVLILSFSIYTVLGIIESIPVGLNYYSYEYKKLYPRIIDGYALLACFYWPVTLGMLLWEKKSRLKILLAVSLFVQTLVIYLYETRIAIIVCLISALFTLLTAKCYKLVFSCLALVFIGSVILGLTQPDEMIDKMFRYKSIFAQETYVTHNGSFSISELQNNNLVGKLLQAGILQLDKNDQTYVFFDHNFQSEKQLIQSLKQIGVTPTPAITTRWQVNYKNRPGFSGRSELWPAAWDLIRERPFLGYGYNPKVFAQLAVQPRFMKKWQQTFPTLYKELSNKHPHSNPHNLFLSLLLETGIIGLLAFLTLWGNFIGRLLKKSKQTSAQDDRLFLYALVLAPCLAFFSVNMLNSLWNGTSGKLIMVIMAVGSLFLNEEGFLPREFTRNTD